MAALQPAPRRRYRVRFFFIPVGAIALLTVFLVRSCDSGPTVTGDYRDTAVLARAVAQGAQRHGDGTPFAENCVQLIFPNYFCTVDFYGGAIGNYQVSVAADGSSWYAS